MMESNTFDLSDIRVDIAADTDLLDLYDIDSFQLFCSISSYVMEIDDKCKDDDKAILIDGNISLAFVFNIKSEIDKITYYLKEIVDFENIYLDKNLRTSSVKDIFDKDSDKWEYIKARGKY